MNRMAFTLHVLITGIGLALASSQAWAEDHVVAPNTPWPTAAEVKPGDRILLAPGLHPARTLQRYTGTMASPIRIDSVDPSSPAIIGGGTWPLQLLECNHLYVGTLMLTLGSEGGMLIRGTADKPSTDVRLMGTYLAQAGKKPGVSNALDAAHVDSLVLESVQIDAWQRSAVHIEHAQRVFIQNLFLTGSPDSLYGVELGTNVKDVNIRHMTLEQLDGTGLRIAASNAAEPKTPTPDATTPNESNESSESSASTWGVERLFVARCSFIRTKLPIALGSARSINITNNLFYGPRTCVMGFEEPPAGFASTTEVVFSRNLSSWQVGDLKAFFCSSDNATGLSIGPNLWWSSEMPEAAEYLGPLPDDADSRQIYNLDPNLTPRSLQPRAPLAQAFGPYGPLPQERGKSPRDNPTGPE